LDLDKEAIQYTQGKCDPFITTFEMTSDHLCRRVDQSFNST